MTTYDKSKRYKILIDSETGQLRPPICDFESERPAPPDMEWHEILPGSLPYRHYIDCEDLLHLDLDACYYDFEIEDWVEEHNTPPVHVDDHKFTRNKKLQQSDAYVVRASTPEEKQAWRDYRQSLRDHFDDKHYAVHHSVIFKGYITNGILTVTEILEGSGDQEGSGVIKQAMHIEGPGVADRAYICWHGHHKDHLTGTGGVGTYHMHPEQTVGSVDEPITMEGFDYTTFVHPRSPRDLQALKDKAAAGDAEAIEIVTREGL